MAKEMWTWISLGAYPLFTNCHSMKTLVNFGKENEKNKMKENAWQNW